jgi:predicted nuclease with RNAse H fold
MAGGTILGHIHKHNPGEVVDWCIETKVVVVAVDAPCKWSRSGKSRQAESDLAKKGIHCYATPAREYAKSRKFYQWVFNGERLYEKLRHAYHFYDGQSKGGKICFETFPHAIVCALAGNIVPAKPKARVRRKALCKAGFDTSSLANIDFLDAALCAVAANYFRRNAYVKYGDKLEGFIIVPRSI